MEKNEKEKLFLLNGDFFLGMIRNSAFPFVLWSPFKTSF